MDPIESVSVLVFVDCSGDCCAIVKQILPQKGTKSTKGFILARFLQKKSFVPFVPFCG
jgi:hypothetical protein